jgi:hypothetical protein
MRLKVQIPVNGVDQTFIIDPNKHWVAIRFSAVELQMLSQWQQNDVFIAAPAGELKANAGVIRKWAQDWPQQFWAGTHRPPGGGLLLPDNIVKNQDGNT